jgi:hypothetical protein
MAQLATAQADSTLNKETAVEIRPFHILVPEDQLIEVRRADRRDPVA